MGGDGWVGRVGTRAWEAIAIVTRHNLFMINLIMISISLKSKTAQSTGAKISRLSRLNELTDEDLMDAAPTSEASGRTQVNKRLSMMNSSSNSKAQRRRIQEAEAVDKSVYQYDEIYDKLQDAKQRVKEAKEADSKIRQPKYIKNLLISAETRRLDHLRAEEKMIQRERDAEGDEFADKEQFVTQAYKDQMAAVRKAEEEEKRRERAFQGMHITLARG